MTPDPFDHQESATPLRLEYLDPRTLAPNPLNWRSHPEAQVRTAEALIYGADGGRAEVGWADAVRFNSRTGRLVDGHMRVALAVSNEDRAIPVLVGDWTPDQERTILASLDALGLMADADPYQLTELHKLLEVTSPEVRGLLDAVAAAAVGNVLPDSGADLLGAAGATGDGDGGESAQHVDSPPADGPSDASVPDCVWPSDNPFDVPTLDIALAANAVDFPVTTWGTLGHSRAMRGTYHFYTADRRFDPLWSNPGKVLLSGCPSVVEPNFSTHEQTPFAVSLWAIYRKRWLARYWQSRGVRILVDINVHHSLLEPHEATHGLRPNFLGVPKGWPAYATRAHGNDQACGFLDREYAAAAAHGEVETLPVFLVVGGGKQVKAHCGARGWSWVPEASESARTPKGKP